MYPLVELVAYDGVDYVGEPGPRNSRQVSFIWEVVVQLGVLGSDIEQVLGSKPLVMR